MKLSSALIVLQALIQVSGAFKPTEVSFDSLSRQESADSIREALSQVGLVSVLLPEEALEAYESVGRHQHACLQDYAGDIQKSSDGTTRFTLASQTNGDVASPLFASVPEDCREFEAASQILRKYFHKAIQSFAENLETIFPTVEGPILETRYHDQTFADIVSVVRNAQHLEHFHSYVKDTPSASTTLDIHVDQGIFLAFTPGRETNTGKPTTGFFLRDSTEQVHQVEFGDKPQIVFLLGDGISHINNKLVPGIPHLRPLPHGLQINPTESSRVWYGRMVLAPAQALHPQAPAYTFGELRKSLIAGTDIADLGCSGTEGITTAFHRMLDGNTTTTEEEKCPGADEVYCWHRCMNYTDFAVSDEICASVDATVKCMNPRSQLWSGESHGDYYPQCAKADAPIETDFPTLPDYPRDDQACDSFDDFVVTGSEGYPHSMQLDGETGAVLAWEVVDGKLRGHLMSNGIFGWLGFGFSGTGGRNRMANSHVIMALRGGEYSPATGLDLSVDPEVNQHRIFTDYSFRHWMTPHGADETVATERAAGDDNNSAVSYKVDFNECYTSLKFENLESIAGKEFNFDGSDSMMWAANRVDTFAGYHGGNRGVHVIEWNPSEDEKSTSDANLLTVALATALVGLATLL